MLSLLPHVIIIFAAFAGMLIAAYIRHKKIAHEVLACPLHSNCEAVTHSEFSRFLGIPVELLGVGYYLLTASFYAVLLILPSLESPYLVFGLVALTTAAFMFSLYLTFIQAFTLRQWCTWCLVSAGLCTLIFVMTLMGSSYSILGVLSLNRDVLLILHMVGLVLGLGGATIADMFFFKFTKDFRISPNEAATLHTMSQVIWFGLAILILTGLGLYLPDAGGYNEKSKFLVKMLIVGVITINGAFLNLFVSPRLIHMVFGGPQAHAPGKMRNWRKVAFALGGVSMTSWYSAFILGMLRNVPLSFGVILGIYLAIVTTAVLGSQVIESQLHHR